MIMHYRKQKANEKPRKCWKKKPANLEQGVTPAGEPKLAGIL
jgi:hypothetical protein